MSARLTARPGNPLSGIATAPGDKSISHRALILGGLATGTTKIAGLLESADVLATKDAVRALGAEVTREGNGWRVQGARWRSPRNAIDCGNSGTAVRLLMGAAAAFPLSATFTGDASLSQRPMARVTEPLTRMGARFEPADKLPIKLDGGGLQGGHFTLKVASAQVKSAILLAGLGAEGEVSLTEPVRSRDHSERMLRAFGADVTETDTPAGHYVALGGARALTGQAVRVPGDPSSAAFPLCAGLIVPGSHVRVEGVLANPARTGLFKTLRAMGADLTSEPVEDGGGEQVAHLIVRAGALSGVEVPAGRAASMIDEYPVLAVVAAFATGTTVMRGVSELRVKESDRIALTIDGLRACGVECEDGPDWFAVHGRGGEVAGGAEIETHGDHRIAMAFLVLGLGARAPVRVRDADMIATSFPGFGAMMRSLGADIG
jgi:3-phosphoshikimate 1-carboxyvinyltransferase